MILIGLGGSVGAAARYMIGQILHKKNPNHWMNGTWVVNIVGSLLLGVLASLYWAESIPEWSWMLFGTGFCGAFTTFSTFSVDVLKMIQEKQGRQAFSYVITSVLLGFAAATLGFLLVK